MTEKRKKRLLKEKKKLPRERENKKLLKGKKRLPRGRKKLPEGRLSRLRIRCNNATVIVNEEQEETAVKMRMRTMT